MNGIIKVTILIKKSFGISKNFYLKCYYKYMYKIAKIYNNITYYKYNTKMMHSFIIYLF